jgi:hypothetical protein
MDGKLASNNKTFEELGFGEDHDTTKGYFLVKISLSKL